jgi:prefoldin subunit 5
MGMKGWVNDLYRLAMRLANNELPELIAEVKRLNDELESLNDNLERLADQQEDATDD